MARKPGEFRSTKKTDDLHRLVDEIDRPNIAKQLGYRNEKDIEKPKIRSKRERKILPYPTTKEARERTKQIHRSWPDPNNPPWFHRASDNTYHRWDPKGGGKLGLIDANRKILREVNRAAAKKGLTPKLEDYIAVHGEVRGPDIFKAEQSKLRSIYKGYDPRTHDIDHLESQKSRGVHHTRNLNPQELAANRAEGNRGRLPKEVHNKLMTDPGGDIRKTLALQGPELTQDQKDLVMKRAKGGKGLVGEKAKALKSYDYINKQQLKAARFTGKAARYALGPASVLITGALATDQARATEANPTVRNQILNVGRQLEAYTDAAGLATAVTGVGAPATLPLEAASMLIGGLTDTYEALSGWQRLLNDLYT